MLGKGGKGIKIIYLNITFIIIWISNRKYQVKHIETNYIVARTIRPRYICGLSVLFLKTFNFCVSVSF